MDEGSADNYQEREKGIALNEIKICQNIKLERRDSDERSM